MSRNCIRRAGPPSRSRIQTYLLYHARSAMWKIGLIPNELGCCGFLETVSGMAVGCGADNRRAPSPSNRENPSQIQAEVC
jgi:hypothetical protein